MFLFGGVAQIIDGLQFFCREGPVLSGCVEEAAFVDCVFAEGVDDVMGEVWSIDLAEGSKGFLVLVVLEEEVGVGDLCQL